MFNLYFCRDCENHFSDDRRFCNLCGQTAYEVHLDFC
jgi:hypothetical protein